MLRALLFIFSGSTAQHRLWPPRHTRFLDHTQRRAKVGRTLLRRVISSSQRPLPDNTQHTQKTNIHAPGGIRNHDRSRRAAIDLRLRLRGHRDWQSYVLYLYIIGLGLNQRNGMCDFRFLPRNRWEIRSSGMLRSVYC
jgi:hypothetical protein